MRGWEYETAGYQERVLGLGTPLGRAQDVVSATGLVVPLDVQPTPLELLALKPFFFCCGIIRTSTELVTALQASLRDGSFVTVSLQTRFLFELWGAAAFSRDIAEKVQTRAPTLPIGSDAWVALDRRADRLIMGSKYLIARGLWEMQPHNVLDFVRAIPDDGAQLTYSFLSESCHPSFLPLTNLHMAGSQGDNWGNDAFQEEGHYILETFVDSSERSVAGIEAAVNIMADVAGRLAGRLMNVRGE